jgi:hypothetical protein
MEVTLFIWSYCQDMKNSSLNPGFHYCNIIIIILYVFNLSDIYIMAH